MRARTRFLLLTLLAVGLAGCAADDGDSDESTAPDDPLPKGDGNSSAMCVEGAEDCEDTPTMETVEDPYAVGS